MEPQEYAFFIENEVKGPFSRAEAEAKIARKEVTPDTPCAPSGASDWEPASKFFTFPASGGIRLRTRQSHAETSEVTSVNNADDDRPSLDLETRKRVIQLGIADAATLDNLTVEQAKAAIRAHDEAQEKSKKTSIIGGVSALVGALVIGLIFGSTSVGEPFNNWVANKFVKENAAYQKTQTDISRELTVIREAQKTLAASKLAQPEGRSGKDYFESRVVIPAQKSSELIFHIDYKKLSEYTDEKPTVIYVKQMPADIKKEMLRQADLVWKYKHPETLVDPLTPAELAASWELFKKRVGNTLPNFIKENTQDIAKDAGEGDITVNGRNAVNLVAMVTVNDFPVYFPYDNAQRFVTFSKPQQHVVTREEALDAERYVVTEKATAGGGFYGIKVRFMSQHYILKCEAPVWHYVALARAEIDKSPSWIMVTPEEYEKTAVGAEFPTKKLFDYTMFDRPLPSPLSGVFETVQ